MHFGGTMDVHTPRCCPLPTAHELLCPWDLWYWIKLSIQSHCACSVSWALSLGLNRPPHPFLTLISQPPFLLFAGIHSEHAWQHPVPVENTGGHIASWPGPLLLVSRRDRSCFLILPPYIHPFILLINTYGCYPSALWGTGVALAHLEVNVKHNLVLEETGATFNCMQLIKIFSNSQIFICSLSFTRLKLYRFYAAQANRKLQHIVLTVQDTNFFFLLTIQTHQSWLLSLEPNPVLIWSRIHSLFFCFLLFWLGGGEACHPAPK